MLAVFSALGKRHSEIGFVSKIIQRVHGMADGCWTRLLMDSIPIQTRLPSSELIEPPSEPQWRPSAIQSNCSSAGANPFDSWQNWEKLNRSTGSDDNWIHSNYNREKRYRDQGDGGR